MAQTPVFFAIKAEVPDPDATFFRFTAQKTMYRGRDVAAGDCIFIFASENEGGNGLVARGIVISSEDVPKTAAARQTPRVSITVERTGSAQRSLGRAELRGFRNWSDERPETELNFKLYRQATNKVVGLTADTGEFLNSLF